MAWVKGKSGNPNGRPVSKPWTDAINRAIKRRETSDPLALEKLADKLLDMADSGDMSAMKELGDRLDGKPKQQTELSGPEGEAIPIGVDVRIISRPG